MTLAAMFNSRSTRRDNHDHRQSGGRNLDAAGRKTERRYAASARASMEKTEQLRAVDEFFADEYWLEECAAQR